MLAQSLIISHNRVTSSRSLLLPAMVWTPDVRIKTALASGSASSSASARGAALANFVTPAVAAPPVGAQPVHTDASLQAVRSPSMQPNGLPHDAFFLSLTGNCEREDPSRIPNSCQCTLAPEPIAVSACEPMPTSLQANRSTSMQANQSPQTPPCTVIEEPLALLALWLRLELESERKALASGSVSSSASAPEAAFANFVTPAVAAPPVGAQPVDNRSTSMQVNQSPQTPPCKVIKPDSKKRKAVASRARIRFCNFKWRSIASRAASRAAWYRNAAAARKFEQAAYSTGVFVAPEDPWSDPADPYALVILISADTETENVPDPVKEEIVSPHTESDDEKEAWRISVANDPSEDLSPDGDGGQHDDIGGACWQASDDLVGMQAYQDDGEGWKASEDIVEDMKEEQDMQAYQDGEAEASEEIAATRTESDDEREAWAKAVAKAKAKAWQRWYREAGQSRSASSSGVNSSISVVVPAVENVPSAAAAAADIVNMRFKYTRAQERNVIKYLVMRLWQRSISKTRDGGGEDAQ